MTISDGDGGVVTVDDVTFGDVYICAGDDEMASAVGTLPAAEVAAIVKEAASNFTTVRIFAGSSDSQAWASAADAAALTQFSGLCYASGRAMQKSYNPTGLQPSAPSNLTCPVGLISAAAAGARLIEWAPPAVARQSCSKLGGRNSRQTADAAGSAFAKYIAPLQSLAIRGMFWSHGSSEVAAAVDSGVDNAELYPSTVGAGTAVGVDGYAACFQATVTSWRDGGNIGDWSIAYSQLSSSVAPNAPAGAVFAVQDAQNAARPHPGLEGLTTTSMASDPPPPVPTENLLKDTGGCSSRLPCASADVLRSSDDVIAF